MYLSSEHKKMTCNYVVVTRFVNRNSFYWFWSFYSWSYLHGNLGMLVNNLKDTSQHSVTGRTLSNELEISSLPWVLSWKDPGVTLLGLTSSSGLYKVEMWFVQALEALRLHDGSSWSRIFTAFKHKAKQLGIFKVVRLKEMGQQRQFYNLSSH